MAEGAALSVRVTADIENLRAQMTQATASVKNFSAQAGPGISNVSKELSNLGSTARGSIEHISHTQKAIENLTNADHVAAHEVQGFSRHLLHIVPVAAFVILEELVSSLKDVIAEMFGASAATKAFQETLQSSSKAFVDAYTAVSELVVQGELLNKGIGDRTAFLKHYNETLGKTIGETDDLKTAEENLTKFGVIYIQMQYLKSIANTAFAKSAEAALASLVIQQQAGNASGIAGRAFRDLRKEADDNIETYKNLGENATKLLAVLQQKIPPAVSGMLSGLLGGEGGQAKPVKIKELKVELPKRIKFEQKGEFDFIDDEGILNEFHKKMTELINKALSTRSGTSVFGNVDISQAINFSETGLGKIRRNLLDKLHKAGISTADRTLENGVAIKIPIEIATTKELNAAFDKVQGMMEKRADDLNKIVADVINNSISDLADNLAKLASGKGSIGGLFDGIFKSMGAGLKELGAYMVKTGLEISIFKNLITSNPAAAIAAGFALELLGSLVESSLSKRAAFATGVRNYTGGMALVGERGPELVQLPKGSNVITNGQLSAMGGGDSFVASYTIRGTDLITVINRSNKFISRNG
jgi:hypothetical protein